MPRLQALVLVGILALCVPAAAPPPVAAQATTPLLRPAIDQRSLARPARNHLYLCDGTSMAAPRAGLPWVQGDGVLDNGRKPRVGGSVAWAGHRLNAIAAGPDRTITTNGLPSHPTGKFPITVEESPDAFAFDRNPNEIRQALRVFNLPINPEIAARPSCLPLGPIGIALTGALFFTALDADLRDAVATEIFDACEGHPQQQGRYHYHHDSPCFDQGRPDQHSPLVGFALDGFAIFGPRDADGRPMTNEALDECHGHVGPVLDANGATVIVYHYHITKEFPYVVGCFKGAPTIRPNGRTG
jgi:hypothetical protein